MLSCHYYDIYNSREGVIARYAILSMPYYGKDMSKFSMSSLSLVEKNKILNQINASIALMHACEVYHCDIKDENICLSDDLTPTIIDFSVCEVSKTALPYVGMLMHNTFGSHCPFQFILFATASDDQLDKVSYDLRRSMFPPHLRQQLREQVMNIITSDDNQNIFGNIRVNVGGQIVSMGDYLKNNDRFTFALLAFSVMRDGGFFCNGLLPIKKGRYSQVDLVNMTTNTITYLSDPQAYTFEQFQFIPQYKEYDQTLFEMVFDTLNMSDCFH